MSTIYPTGIQERSSFFTVEQDLEICLGLACAASDLIAFGQEKRGRKGGGFDPVYTVIETLQASLEEVRRKLQAAEGIK